MLDSLDLPTYLRRSIDEYNEHLGDRMLEGSYWWQLNSDINAAEADRDIHPDTANYLRKTILGMEIR